MKNIALGLTVIAAMGLAACEKDSGKMPAAKGSGKLTADEAELLARLPAGGNVVFGGNYFGLQQWLANSPMARMSAEMDPVMGAWNACLTRVDFAMAGAGGFDDGVLRMAMFMKGLPMAKVRQCATDSGLPVQDDPDGKFLSVELETRDGMPLAMPYLEVDGGLYTVVSMKIETAGGIKPVALRIDRATLERDQAGLANATLATDPRMGAWLAKVDRTRTFFFAGSGAGSPIADKVGLVYGGISIKDGLAIDVTAELLEPGAASEVVRQWQRARSELDRIPASMQVLKDIIRAVKLGRTGDGVRVVARVTDAQLEELVKALGPMMAGLRP
ncbi:MAG: hypothetical protein IPL61_20305 [Myxococcales bacterium]|nr:hypothetical protein [Myxococcales bacterium]